MDHEHDKPLGDYAALLPKNNLDDISAIIDSASNNPNNETAVEEELRKNEEEQKNILKRIQEIVTIEESKIAEQDPEISMAVKRLSKVRNKRLIFPVFVISFIIM
jgi:hypothetical protein